jgi:hypothetical protein
MKYTPLLITSIAILAASPAPATFYSYDFSGKVTPTFSDTFYDDHHPGRFTGNVSWDSEKDGMTGGSLTVSTTYGLNFFSSTLDLAGNEERHNLNGLGGVTGTGEWTWGVPTDYAILVLNFERNTPLQDAVLSLFAGVSNILTGEQRTFSMESQITHVHTVPDTGSTLAMFGLALAAIGGFTRFRALT